MASDRGADAAGQPATPVLRRIAQGDLCAGCGACARVFPDRITMGTAPPGFLRPRETARLL
ncbi:hypothetical protein ACROSR_17040 [Roseovarius tibetensis]|uniref:hypothetical protein n=1 Tax=Roseovarius tibetensis TaxID=2685897 RepID=UPI003D7F5818